jgi:molecular chaperone GrpE
LTPAAIEAVLNDFRSWLEQLAANGTVPAPAECDGSPETEPIDLHTLLGQFIALRHEVNLQTKAVRAQQEQNGETLRYLGQALEAVCHKQEAAQQAEQQKQDEVLRPLLKALVDMTDALGLARREMQRALPAIGMGLDRLQAAPAPVAEIAPQPPVGVLRRWFGGQSSSPTAPPSPGAPGPQAAVTAGQVRQLLEALVTGYTMSIQRGERALRQCGLESISCVGQAFDPERMEAVEVVLDHQRAPGEVIEEVRPGYLWNGRVFRYAQVRVAKS